MYFKGLQFGKLIFRRQISASNESERVEAVYSTLINMRLSEVNQLVEKLKSNFNIVSIASSATAAPGPSSSTSATPVAQKEAKTEYNVILQKIDASNKAKIIREIKVLLPSLNLVEAKNFVESAPKLIKDKVKQEEANSIKTTLEALGAHVSLE